MMNRRWLEQTIEPILDPDLEIVDAHHHLWDTVTRYGRYELSDLLLDAASGHRIVQTVFIDCGASYRSTGPVELRPVGETAFVAEQAEASDRVAGPSIAAIVGHADLTLGTAVGEVLDAHLEAGRGRFRGVRHTGARDDDPTIPTSRTAPVPDLYREPAFVAGARALADRGLSFDAWQYHHQTAMVVDLARAVEDLTIVVNHLGGPLGVGRWTGRRDEVDQVVRAGLTELAGCPNVVLKLGGVGMTRFGVGWERDERPPTSVVVARHWGDLIRFGVDRFGPERCLFESNYPVDGETVGYAVLWNAFKRITDDLGPAERSELFAGTARRVYRLPVVESS